MMDLRPFTSDDLRVLRSLWGHAAIEAARAITTVFNGAYNGRPACLFEDTGPVTIFCDPAFGIAYMAHELGHAIHCALFPESRTKWDDLKCETFALLATANACRQSLRLGCVRLTDGERHEFAFHARGIRKSGPLYRKALAEAHRIAASPFLSRQVVEAAHGRPH